MTIYQYGNAYCQTPLRNTDQAEQLGDVSDWWDTRMTSCSKNGAVASTFASSRIRKKFLVALFVLCMISAWVFSAFAISPLAIAESEGAQKPKAICIVYDDSGSMEGEGNFAWEQAHYAIEVFAAMLGPNDTMEIFTMSSADEGATEPDLIINGSAEMSERVAAAHSNFSKTHGWTNFNAAVTASERLKIKSPDEYDRYLVILTDGAFNVCDNLDSTEREDNEIGTARRATNEQVAAAAQNHLKTWSTTDQINVEYVAMGNDASDFLPTSDGNRLRVSTIDGGHILSGIIDESNLIFGRGELNSYNAGSGELNLEIPTKRIVVFAQGQGVSIGDLEGTDPKAKAEKAQVSHVDTPHDPDYRNAEGKSGNEDIWDGKADPSLQGRVAVFTPVSGEGFNVGTAHLNIENADTVNIYYQPYVDIELTLVDSSGNQFIADSAGVIPITADDYSLSYRLLNPFNPEEEIDSPLIDKNKLRFSTRLTYENGDEIILGESDSFRISDGTGTITSFAAITDEVSIDKRYDVVVMPRDLEVAVVGKPKEPLDVHTLSESDPLIVKVTKSGQPLDQSQWQNTALDVSSPDSRTGIVEGLFAVPKSIGYEVQPGDEPSTFKVFLKPYNDTPAETLSGNVPLHFRAVYDSGLGQMSYGEGDDAISINGAGFWERFLHWLWLHWVPILITILVILFLTWLFGAGRLRKRFSPSVIVDGRTQSFDGKPARMMQPIPFRNKWGAERKTPTRLKRKFPKGQTPDSIKLHGAYWKFGRVAEFVNYSEWVRDGWKISNSLSKKGKQKRAQKKAGKGKSATVRVGRKTTLTKDGYRIVLWDRNK